MFDIAAFKLPPSTDYYFANAFAVIAILYATAFFAIIFFFAIAFIAIASRKRFKLSSTIYSSTPTPFLKHRGPRSGKPITLLEGVHGVLSSEVICSRNCMNSRSVIIHNTSTFCTPYKHMHTHLYLYMQSVGYPIRKADTTAVTFIPT